MSIEYRKISTIKTPADFAEHLRSLGVNLILLLLRL